MIQESGFFLVSGLKGAGISRQTFKLVAGSVREGALVDGDCASGGFAPIELLGMFESFGAKLFTKACVGGDASQCELPRFEVFRVELDSGLADDFAE